MKLSFFIKSLLILGLLTTQHTLHAKTYLYHDLQMMDLDKMRALVSVYLNRVDASIKENHALKEPSIDDDDEEAEEDYSAEIEILRKALLLVLSRPNQSNILSTLITPVKSELSNFNAYDETLLSLANSALRSINNKGKSAAEITTSFFVLHNMMSQVQPTAKYNPIHKEIFQLIASSKIKIPPKTKGKQLLRSMLSLPPLSKVATEVLKNIKTYEIAEQVKKEKVLKLERAAAQKKKANAEKIKIASPKKNSKKKEVDETSLELLEKSFDEESDME